MWEQQHLLQESKEFHIPGSNNFLSLSRKNENINSRLLSKIMLGSVLIFQKSIPVHSNKHRKTQIWIPNVKAKRATCTGKR